MCCMATADPVSLTDKRRDNLCTDTDAFLAANGLTRLRKSFLFGSLKDVLQSEPPAILDLFFRPGNATAYSLFPALAEMAEGA